MTRPILWEILWAKIFSPVTHCKIRHLTSYRRSTCSALVALIYMACL